MQWVQDGSRLVLPRMVTYMHIQLSCYILLDTILPYYFVYANNKCSGKTVHFNAVGTEWIMPGVTEDGLLLDAISAKFSIFAAKSFHSRME